MDEKGYFEFKVVYPELYTVTIRTPHTELSFDELVEAFRAFAHAAGFHADTVNAFFDSPDVEARPEGEPAKKGKKA